MGNQTGRRDMDLIILAAGQGTRMGHLTHEVPKPLVEIESGRSILESNLLNLTTVGANHRVLVVGGHCWEQIREFVEHRTTEKGHIVALFNKDYMTSGPLRSVRVGLEAARANRVIVANGDTLFNPALLKRAGSAQLSGGAHLFVSRQTEPEDDDILVSLNEDGRPRVVEAGKHVKTTSCVVSSGLLLLDGHATVSVARTLVSELISDEDQQRKPFAWHSLLSAFHTVGMPAMAHFVPHEWWHEFDTHSSIEDRRSTTGTGERAQRA